MKGIKEFTDKINPELLNSSLCMGFLEKKRKKLSTFQKRWFVLISSKPFISSECSVSEETNPPITEDQLPPWMELDTVFYFHYKSNFDKSPFIGKISLRNFISISMENQQHKLLEDSADGYFFKLITKERTFVFNAELITEMNKWIMAIEGSRKNYLESHNENMEDDQIRDQIINVTAPHHMLLRSNTFGACALNNEEILTLRKSELIHNKIRNKTICEEENKSRNSSLGRKEKEIAKEGYLMKKSMHKFNKVLGWEKRYVTLKDSFFWSISNTNLERRNNIQFKDLEKCEKIKEDQFALVSDLIFFHN